MKLIFAILFSFVFSFSQVIKPWPEFVCSGTDDCGSKLTAIGSTNATLVLSKTYVITSNVTIPSNVLLRPTREGRISRAHTTDTLFINGPFEAGRFQIFDTIAPVIFQRASFSFASFASEGIYPEWFGAKGDGTTDDTKALRMALVMSHNQYVGTSVNLGAGQYAFTKTLTLRKRIDGSGFRLIPSGDGTGFDTSQYSLTTAPTKVRAAIVIQDGGVLEGGSVTVTDTNLDRSANQSLWLVDLESSFGKNPMYNMRIDGMTARRNLGAVIVRYNTTSDFGPFGGSFFLNGLYVDASNECNFKGIFFEFIQRGGNPFYFTNSSNNTLQGSWTEGDGNNLTGFFFDGVSNYTIRNLKVGDPDGGGTLTGTSDAAANTITQNSNYIHANNDRIRFDVAPGGLNTTTIYYVVNANSSTYQVSLTSGGAAIDITTSVAVTWRSALQGSVLFRSCDRMDARNLDINQSEPFVGGYTAAQGSSIRLIVDDTYLLKPSGYGMYAEFQYKIPEPVTFRNVNVSDTSIPLYLGRPTGGSQIVFVVTAHTAGLSGYDGGLNIWKLTGSGYTLKGTVTPASSGALSSIGNVAQMTWNQDATENLYIAPITPAGNGSIDVRADWNPVSGQ